MRIEYWTAVVMMLGGCASAHVGVGVPIPGPIKPSVGVTVDKKGVKGSAGVGAKVGPVPVHVGGSTKSYRPEKDATAGKRQCK